MRRYKDTSSTELEVRTVLWALEDYLNESKVSGPATLRIYSDSQCVTGLLKRRPGLEANCFHGIRANRPLKNASLYQAFYRFHDEIRFDVIKVKGHSRLCSRDTVQRIFSLVDKEARKGLSLWTTEIESKKIIY